MSGKDKVQNHHNCLLHVLKSIRDISNRGGIRTTVLGRKVHIKVWIHTIMVITLETIVDPSIPTMIVNAHSPTWRRQIQNAYIQPCEKWTCWSVLENNESEGLVAFQQISQYPIKNVLLERGVPLSDQVHGPFRMTPPELLHTSGAGLIMYMFKVIAETIGAGINRDDLDKQHVQMQASLSRQSDRDFPRGATRNGIVDGTKSKTSE